MLQIHTGLEFPLPLKTLESEKGLANKSLNFYSKYPFEIGLKTQRNQLTQFNTQTNSIKFILLVNNCKLFLRLCIGFFVMNYPNFETFKKLVLQGLLNNEHTIMLIGSNSCYFIFL